MRRTGECGYQRINFIINNYYERKRKGFVMYNFKWNSKEGLKYIDEEMYKMACLLANKIDIEIDKDLYTKTDEEGNAISKPLVRFHIKSSKCFGLDQDKRVTTECYMKHAVENEMNLSGELIFWNSQDSISMQSPLNNCSKCVYSKKCIYPYAAYIKNLLDKNL